MTTYFKFDIPDGVSYSPGWHGTMDKCPKKVTVLLYNDKEGFGIAKANDSFKPDEVEVLTKTVAMKIVDAAKDEEGVYFGEKLDNKWNPEVLIEDVVQEPDEGISPAEPVTQKAIFCPICHKFIMRLPETIVAGRLNLTCPDGHKVVLNGR